MKVMLVNGSPNKNGCTYTALREIAKTLETHDIETEIFWIKTKPITGCIACGKCSELGKCTFDDVVNEFVEKAYGADAFVFGSPVYYAGANGSMTSFLDRAFYSNSHGCGVEAFKHKPGAVVCSARRAGTTATYDQLIKYLGISQMPIVSSFYWNMVHGNTPEEVLQDEEGLGTMRQLAHNIAFLLKCIEVGAEKGLTVTEENKPRTNFIRKIMNIFKTPEGYLYSNRALLALFIPLLIEYGLEFLMGFADSVMVASLGEAAISGVSLVDFLVQLLIFSFSALGTGGAVVAGQYLGNNQIKKAQDSATQLIWFSTILSTVLMIIVVLLRQFLIGLLFGQIDVDVWAIADVYLYIIALSIPFLAIYNAGAAIFRTTNDASLPMKILLVCDVLNVIGNAICIYYLGWDVRGVAIPTVLSRALAAILILYFVVDDDYKLHIKKTLKHKFDFVLLKKVLQVGIPYGVENGLFQLGRVLVLSIVSTFGTMAIAANSVGYAIGIFSVLPGFAINLGLTAVVSNCVGANDYEQVRYYNKKILILVVVSHIVVNAIIIACLPLILSIYQLSAHTAAMASEMIIWHGIFAIIIWPLSFTLPSTFRGAGDSKSVMYISLAVMFACRIGLSYVIADWMGVGVFGTWIAMFIDWYVRAGIYVYRYFSNKWTEYRVV